MQFDWPNEELDFRRKLRDFLDRELPEHWFQLVPGEDPASDFTREFCAKLAREDLLVPHWPREHGGLGASGWQFIILGEELWRAGEPRGAQYMNVNWIGPAIMQAGTEEQKADHLSRIAAGDVIWCQGFSEPEAGTDLGALATTAEKKGDEYVLNGTKVWTSYAQVADFCFILARTDPSSRGTRGISIFLVPTDLPGFEIEPLAAILDIHQFNRLTFRDLRVPASMRLGPEHGGWGVVREALANERIGGPRYARAQMVLNQLQESAVESGAWAESAVRAEFGSARSTIEAARLLAYNVIDDRVKDRPNGPIVSLARVAIVRAERAVAEIALDLLGTENLRMGSVGNSQLKTSMIAGLGGGSVEVQLNMIARALLDAKAA